MMDTMAPPLTYFQRAKNLLNEILNEFLVSRLFLKNIEEVSKPLLGQEFSLRVKNAQV